MRALIGVSLLALSLSAGDAMASSHREAPTRGSGARTVVEPSLYESLREWILGPDAAPPPPELPAVTVRRAGYTPPAR